MSEETPTNRSRWLVVCLSLIPLWLALSAGVAVWWALRSDDKEEEERNQRFAMEMSVERIAEDMRKLVEVIGPRDAEHPEALMRAAAMIDGTLGPSNTGYQIQRIPGPGEAPIIRANLTGKNKSAAPYWVIASYDASTDDEFLSSQSSSVTALIAIAQAMARDEPECGISFLFYPVGHDPKSRGDEVTKSLLAVSEPPKAVFYLGWMQAGGQLMAISPLDDESLEVKALQGIGIHVKDAAMVKTALEIQNCGLPTYFVISTTSTESKSDPSAANIAICAGKLVEWLRRAARLEAQD